MGILEEETVQFCSKLIQIDTHSPFAGGGPGELAAAQYIAEKLAEVGIASEIYEAEPGRASLVARIPGRSRDALMLHSHLDVVPTDPTAWTVPPYSGLIRDGYVWGRGAVDMKNMAATILACARELARTGTVPARDLVLAFFADEENGTVLGSSWMVEHHAHQFAGVTAAVGEVGGFGIAAPSGAQVHFLECARKGVAWFELTATDVEGHGSITRATSAITELSAAVSRIAAHRWSVDDSGHNAGLVDAVRTHFGIDLTSDEPDAADHPLRGVSDFLRSAIRDVSNVTMLEAGSSPNVVPGTARAVVDGRFLPGHEADFLARVRELAGPTISVRMLDLTPADVADPEGDIVADFREALRLENPDSVLVPYVSSAGTDSASFAPLRISGYGFVPHELPEGFPFARLFHNVDERIPLTALHSGVRNLFRLLTLPDRTPAENGAPE